MPVETIKKLWKLMLDFLYPPVCLVCGEPADFVICRNCAASLSTRNTGYCPVCERPLDKSQIACEKHRTEGIDFVRPLAEFDPVHRELIHAFKYDAIVDLGEFFGREIGKTIASEPRFENYEYLIPVPLHRERFRERTYNQAEILARYASKVSGKPVITDLVIRTRHTKSQTKLSPTQRRENVRGAFAVTRPEEVRGKSFIIVDDVVTTGATTGEIARTLIKHGARRVCAVCIAHPQHHESKMFGI